MDYKEDKELTKETKIILLKILKRGFITEEEKNYLITVFQIPLFKIVLPNGTTLEDYDKRFNI